MDYPRWTDEFLDSARHRGDPLADEAIAAIFAEGNAQAVNQIMRVMVENDDLPQEGLPEPVLRYIQESCALPDWADKEKLLAGSRLFNRYGPEIVLMLFGASLPVLYAAHPGCEVLIATSRLTKNIHRRIIETGQFIIDVTDEKAWEEDGKGIRTTQKIRLMHAATRHFLSQAPNWKEHWREEWLVPICQEDLMGTMLSFSVTIVDALEISNISINKDEREAFLHLWKVIGYILGVEEQLMPADYAEAVYLMKRWSARNHKDTPAGRELMGVMVKFWYDNVPLKIFDGLTSGHCRIWIGDKLSDQLGVPPFDWTVNVLRALHWVWKYEDKFEDSFIPYQSFTRFWTRGLMTALLSTQRGGSRPDFHIPEHLQQMWGMKKK
jgi:hypothetical protein